MHNNLVRNVVCFVDNRYKSNREIYKALSDLVGNPTDKTTKLWMHKASTAQYVDDEDRRYILKLAADNILKSYYADEYTYWTGLLDEMNELIKRDVMKEGSYRRCTKELASTMARFLQDKNYGAGRILISENTYITAVCEIYKLIYTDRYYIKTIRTSKETKAAEELFVNILKYDSTASDLYHIVRNNVMVNGMNVYENWLRFSKLVCAEYALINKVKESGSDNTVLAESGLADLVSNTTVSEIASSFIPGVRVKPANQRKATYRKVGAADMVFSMVERIDKLHEGVSSKYVENLASDILSLGVYLERDTSRDKFIRYAEAAVNYSSKSDINKYAHLATQVVKAYCAENQNKDLNLLKLVRE